MKFIILFTFLFSLPVFAKLNEADPNLNGSARPPSLDSQVETFAQIAAAIVGTTPSFVATTPAASSTPQTGPRLTDSTTRPNDDSSSYGDGVEQ